MAREPQALDNAFAIIQAVAQRGPGVTARELTSMVPLSRASVFRILKHLVAQEYLVRTPDLTGFALGSRVHALVESASAFTPPETNPAVTSEGAQELGPSGP